MFNFKKILHPKKYLVGKKITIIKGEYLGYTGVIEYCKYCHALRIQFDGIGNNERYDKYKDELIIK